MSKKLEMMAGMDAMRDMFPEFGIEYLEMDDPQQEFGYSESDRYGVFINDFIDWENEMYLSARRQFMGDHHENGELLWSCKYVPYNELTDIRIMYELHVTPKVKKFDYNPNWLEAADEACIEALHRWDTFADHYADYIADATWEEHYSDHEDEDENDSEYYEENYGKEYLDYIDFPDVAVFMEELKDLRNGKLPF